MNIKESGEQFCYLLQPILINIIEGAEVFAVNIQYGDDLTIPDNRHYYLRTGGAAAGNMPRKFLYIFYHDGLRFIPSRAANSITPFDAGAGQRSLERTQHKSSVDDPVEAHPPEVEGVHDAC